MSGLEAARGLLPAPVVWGPVLVCVLAAFVLSVLGAAVGAAVALRPLRRAQPLTWAERARLAYPARLVAPWNSLLLPTVQGIVAHALTPPLCGLSAEAFALLVAFASYAGAAWVSFRVERRIRQGRYTLGERLQALAILWLIFLGLVPVQLTLMALMPDHFNLRAWLLVAVSAAVVFLYVAGAGFYLAWVVGLVKPASARLQGIVRRTAAAMDIPVRGVHELSFPVANALAFYTLGRLAFTPKLLAVLDDEEIAAVAAHELGHLSEPALIRFRRLLPVFLFIPLIAARPLANDVGPLAVVGVLALFSLVLILTQRLSRRLEDRADRLAQERQTQEGVYARALAKLYEANLVPPVEPGKGCSHPHLYDRLVAAGVPPDYPRPRPPSRFRVWLGVGTTLFVLLAAWLGLFYLRAPAATDRGDERAILRSLSLGGWSAVGLSDLAAVRYRAGRFEEAAILYRAAGEIDLDPPEYPAYQAMSLAALGRCDEAGDAIREAERRQRRNPRPGGDAVVRLAQDEVRKCVRRERR